MKISGTKPNRKTGIYSYGRRGKKEEEGAVGTLWLRLGEDQDKRKTKGLEVLGGEEEAVEALPLWLLLLFEPKQTRNLEEQSRNLSGPSAAAGAADEAKGVKPDGANRSKLRFNSTD